MRLDRILRVPCALYVATLLLCGVAASGNAAEPHVAHRDLMCPVEGFVGTPVITGKLSEAVIPPGTERVQFDGLVTWDVPEFSVRKILARETAVVRNDPALPATRFSGDTIITLPGSDWRFEQRDRDKAIGFGFIPRAGCTDKSVCLCDDPADIEGGLIFCGRFDLLGAERTVHARPIEITAEGMLVEQSGWRVGDTLCIPGALDGEPTEHVQAASVGGTTTRTVVVPVALNTPFDVPRSPLTFNVGQDSLGGTVVLVSYTETVDGGDPRKVTFDQPLKFPHKLEDDRWPVIENQTSNIMLWSTDPSEVSRRAHVMGHHATAGCRWEYVGAVNGGRTRADIPLTSLVLDEKGRAVSGTRDQLGDKYNPPGRYWLSHFHNITGRDGDVHHTMIGCTGRGFLKWLMDNHGDYVVFENCGGSDGQGAVIAGENSQERGTVRNCFGANVRPFAAFKVQPIQGAGRMAVEDFGWEGFGVWLQGGGMNVEGGAFYDCATAGVGSWGLALKQVGPRAYKPEWLRDGPFKTSALLVPGLPGTGPKKLDPGQLPVSVIGTEIANTDAAVWIKGAREVSDLEWSTLRGLNVTATRRVLDAHYARRILLEDGVFRCREAAVPKLLSVDHLTARRNTVTAVTGFWNTDFGPTVFQGNTTTSTTDYSLRKGQQDNPVNGFSTLTQGAQAAAAVSAANTKADGSRATVTGP